MTDDTLKLVDKYNKTTQSIRSQELAINKLNKKIKSLKGGTEIPKGFEKWENEIKKTEDEAQQLKEMLDKMASQKNEIDLKINKEKRNASILEANGDIGGVAKAEAKYLPLEKDSERIEGNIQKIKKKYDELLKTIEVSKKELSGEVKIANTEKIDELNDKLDLMNDKLQDTKEKLNEIKDEYEDSMNPENVSLLGERIKDVGEKLDKFKTKISRLIGTAMVFSLMRNQLTALRNNFISLLKTNDQFSNSLNQIKANLMTAFTPVYNACLPAINSLMSSLSRLTGTIAVFISGLFGKSIEETTAEAKKLNNALNKTSSNAKKASGSLASFDTLEVIQEPSTASGTDISSSGIDFSGELTYSQKLLDFMNRIKDIVIENKEGFIALGIAIAGAFVISKIVNFVSAFKGVTSLLGLISKLFITVGEDGSKSFNSIGTGITLTIVGLVGLYSSVSDLIQNWDELDSGGKALKITLAVLSAAAIAAGVAMAAAWAGATMGLSVIIGLIAALIAALTALIVSFVNEKDAILSVEDAQQRLNEAQKAYAEANDSYINAVDKAESALKNLEDIEKKTGLSGEELNSQVEAGILNYADMTDAQKEVYKAYLESLSAQDNLETSAKTLTAAKKEETMASFANQLAIAAEAGNYDDYKQSVVKAYEEGKISADEARDLIEQSMSRMSDASQKTFMEDLPADIKNGMDPDRYQTAGQKIKNWFGTLFGTTIPEKLNVLKDKLKTFFQKTLPNLAIAGIETLINKILSSFESLMNLPIKAINRYIKIANKIPTVNLSTFDTVSLGRINIPRLATGTVIPPRQEFMAILGDQKHGTNIEAPLDTIKQANREVLEEFLGKVGINSQDREIVLKNWQFILQLGNNNSFAKMVIDEVKKYEKETNTQFLLT